MNRVFLAATIFLTSGLAHAREYAPRVVSPHRADAYSMKTFAQYSRWRDLHGDKLAWEVYQYLVDMDSGVFHMNDVLEGQDSLSEYMSVRDPVKILNVYGYGYCAIFGPFMAGVWEDMGAGPARTITLPDWQHVASEAFYDGRWHYLDVDVRAAFRRDDGRLASLEESRREPSLWKNRGQLFFPNDPLEETRRVYEKTTVHHYHGFNQSGHTMDYVLRQGETFTRWWTPQGGRWHHRPEYNRQDWLVKLIEQEPRGPKPNHRHFSVHNHANGRLVYEPNLTDKSSDFADGVYDSQNIRPGADGLVLIEPGEGYAVFEVRSPYIIVPLVGKLDTTADDREASVVKLDASGASVAISLDGGLTWHDLQIDTSRPTTLDLTPHVSGTYGYLLKIAFRGQPAAPILRSLSITTWVHVAPASLPVLRKGRNRMEYRTGDHYGLKTRVAEIRANAGDSKELLKYLVEPPADWDPVRQTERIHGPVTVKVTPPPKTRIAWFTAEGSFRTHQGEAAKDTRNTIAYAVDEPRSFREIYRAAVPADTDHWHCNAHQEVKLDQPAKRLYVRYVGDPALNNFHIYAHCLDDGRRSAQPVKITHVWREGENQRIQSVEMKEPDLYEVVTDADPVNVSIEMAVASSAPRTSADTQVVAPVDWIEPMRAVHRRFYGQPGTLAQYGDSITVTMAFLGSCSWGEKIEVKNCPPEVRADLDLITDYGDRRLWREWKGAAFGNAGSMTSRWLRENVDAWQKKLRPEAAVVLFGTNDVGQLTPQEYAENMTAALQRMLADGTVPILTTVPPKSGAEELSREFRQAGLRIARQLKVPVIDYYGEILRRRPKDWDGSLKQFGAFKDYDVPTLISRDGVHPSNPRDYENDFAEVSLGSNGYNLRNYLTLRMYARVIREVLRPAASSRPSGAGSAR